MSRSCSLHLRALHRLAIRRPASFCVAFLAHSSCLHSVVALDDARRWHTSDTTLGTRSNAPSNMRLVGYKVTAEDTEIINRIGDEETSGSSEDPEYTEVEASKLEKTFNRPVKDRTLLSEKDRMMLTNMIFNAFYKFEGVGDKDPAMMYQAALELKWIEEWAAAHLCFGEKRGNINGITEGDVRRIIKKAVIERVDLHKPLSYIIGTQPFFGCDIACRPPLLCPRPETEMWTHWLVYTHLSNASSDKSAGPLRMLDMCSGTGCIGVALAKHVPRAEVVAVDILEEAVQASRENAAANGIPPERYTAVQGDMFDMFLDRPTIIPAFDEAKTNGQVRRSGSSTGQAEPPRIAPEHRGTFDVIVSNPPYVLPQQYVDLPLSITSWESKTALVGDDRREHQQYLYFKELCEYGFQLLKPRKKRDPELRKAPNIAIEVGLQAGLVASVMERSGLWEDVVVHLDYAQQERWVTANSAQ